MAEARLTAPSATPAPALHWTPNRVRLVTVIAIAVLWEAMSRSGLFYRDVVPSIFAVGDVTDRVNLTPVAIREGHVFADTVFGANPRKADHEMVASAVFTQPEMGAVGLSEEAARDAGPVEIYTASFRPMQSLFAGREDRVLMKLVVCKDTRKVLGCHIVGPGAGEMIQMVAIAVKMGATKEDFDRTVAVHPTMAEELVTMRKPVRVA